MIVSIVSRLIIKVLLKRKKKQLLSKAIVAKNQDELFCKRASTITLVDGSTPNDIIIGNKVWMWGRLNSQSGGKISIGNNTQIGYGCAINAVESVSIGNYVMFGPYVTIDDNNNHPVSPAFRKYMRIMGDVDSSRWKHSAHAPVVVGDNCWIGRNVSIMKGVTIGENCVIAANSVVTKSIPANCIVAGNPAKVVKTNIDTIPAPKSCEGYNEFVKQQTENGATK